MLDYNSREDLCNRIINGYAIVHYKNKFYHVYDPTSTFEYQGKSFEKELCQNLVYQGVPTSDQLISILIDKKLWDANNDAKIEEMNKAIDELKKTLPTLEFQSITKQQTLNQIARFKKEINKLTQIKDSILSNSAENIARFEKYRWFLFHLTFKSNGERLWNNWDKFSKSSEKMINYFITNSYFNTEINDKTVRELARTEPWRSIWVYGVKTGNLIPMNEMTYLKKSLISWSLVYDSVYESLDCPPNEIIENDELLDVWFENQRDKREKEKSEKHSDLLKSIDKKHSSAQEVGIVVESIEDAKKVFNMNSALAKSQIRSRFEVVKEKGVANELNMPDVKQNLQMQINNAAIAKGLKRN